MADATCATCPAFSGEVGLGTCRAMAPTVLDDRPWPVVADADWCMQHPLRRRHLLALHAMQGLAADSHFNGHFGESAYCIADQMLAEAAKEPADPATPTPEKTP